jgi:dienelactone hydrolase
MLQGSSVYLRFAMNPLRGFAPYFQLRELESSSNLQEWQLERRWLGSDGSSDGMLYLGPVSADQPARFFCPGTNAWPTPLPMPSGPYPVGADSVLLTDSSRSGRYGVATNSSFMITLWYPARPDSGTRPGQYLQPKMTAAFASLYGLPQYLLSALYAGSVTEAPPASDGPYPVIIYSHGFQVGRQDNTGRCQELASYGFVVVAVDHSDCLATVFPDGKVLRSKITGLSADLFQNDLQDVRFVLQSLEAMNQSHRIFKGTMDLHRVGTMGWSYGGGVAAEICRTDDRVLATLLLEAGLQNAHDVAWLGVQKPLLGMYMAGSFFTTPFDQTSHDAYWMTIAGTQHQHFADWLAWLASPTPAGRNAARVMNRCAVSFFNKYLKGADDQLLDAPDDVFPEILRFMRK